MSMGFPEPRLRYSPSLYRELVIDLFKVLQPGEEIKPIKNHSGLFITSFGRVIRVNKEGWVKFLTITETSYSKKNNRYYYQVRLPSGTYNVHRMVGQYFHPDFQPHLNVCHHDETLPVELINRIDNLWIGTQGDNMRDSYRKGRKTWSNQTYKHLVS